MQELTEKGRRAKVAAADLSVLESKKKDLALTHFARLLSEEKEKIIVENLKDLQAAEKSGLKGAIVDRLTLGGDRIEAMAKGILEVVQLEDPVGEVVEMKKRPNGLMIGKKRVPMGVVGVIYESRPNVTADVAALCVKTGNACILRGGKEAIYSNIAIAGLFRKALEEAGLNPDAVQLVEDTSRESAVAMMKLNEYLDILIPRGGAGLIRTVVENSTVPVIETGVGNCHIYFDESADLAKAIPILVNAK
ncbi:MAG: glutamate-5-semialdehyde dehydrogenase, partial [Bacteroidota bacterium]